MLLLIIQATLKITGTQTSQEADVTGLAGETPREEPECTTMAVLTGVFFHRHSQTANVEFLLKFVPTISTSGVPEWRVLLGPSLAQPGLVWPSPA